MATQKQKFELLNRLAKLGIGYDHAQALRRIEMTLHRWSEAECGDSNDYGSFGIERDETTNKPFRVIRPHSSNQVRRYAIADKESGALKRLSAIMANYPELWSYYQGDPRGCALYVGRKSDLREGDNLDCIYYRGVAVCA